MSLVLPSTLMSGHATGLLGSTGGDESYLDLRVEFLTLV